MVIARERIKMKASREEVTKEREREERSELGRKGGRKEPVAQLKAQSGI